MAWFKRLTEQGKAIAGNPLEREGKIVSGKNGRVVADGPFAESKEAIGGYFLLKVDTPGRGRGHRPAMSGPAVWRQGRSPAGAWSNARSRAKHCPKRNSRRRRREFSAGLPAIFGGRAGPKPSDDKNHEHDKK